MTMKALGDDTVRGGQTVFHSLRMWGQVVRVGLLTVAGLVVAVPAVMLWRTSTADDWYGVGMVTLAETKLSIGYQPDSGQAVRLENGEEMVGRIDDIAAYGPWREARERILGTLYAGAWLGAKIGAALVLAMLGWFRYQGHRLKQKKRVRGAELVTAEELSRRVRPWRVRALHGLAGAPAPYRIAGVPYPERTETQHTIVSGTTGSGKTVLISDLVQQIRQRGDRCVIYDKMGSYTEAFFDPKRDVLLNPLDARAPRWSPFFEARSPRDFDTMAAALIPQQKDTVDPFWVTAARQLFSNGAGVLWDKGVRNNRVLVEHLLKTNLQALAEAMEGTVAQSIVDPENPKTALSVRAMLTAHLGAMEVLADSGEPFSIRKWIGNDRDGGFLFLTSRGDQHATLRGLISTWLEIAVNALLSLDRDDDRRIWVILDELPTLHQVPSLQPGLAESRQFGGCFVLGVQVASALRDLYGRNGAETISGLCGTRVVFAAPDRDTAQWSADSLGRSEIEEVAEGVSYGADPYRDGVTLTPKRELQALALPSEITRLPNLTGYLKFPGPFPVARIELEYVKRPTMAPRFEPRTPGNGPVRDAAAPESSESPEPNGDSRDQSVPVSPDAKPDGHDQPAPVPAGKNQKAGSAATGRAQGEFVFDAEETGSGAGHGEAAAPADGKNEAVVKKSDPPPPPSEDAEAGVVENDEDAPGNGETEPVQSKRRPNPGWVDI